MNILALEFSAPERSVAVARQAANGQCSVIASIHESDFRGITGMMLINRALRDAKLRPPEISMLAVGIGPGSYTGIRSAIAIAQGWQLGRAVETIAIGSDVVLAETARARGMRGELTVIIDAQRGDVYRSRYFCDDEKCREIAPLKIVSGKDLASEGAVVGPEASKFVTGATEITPAAEVLAVLALHGRVRTAAERLEPVYLREATFVKAAPPRRIG